MDKQETIEEAAKKEFPLIDTEWCRTGACEEENLHLLGHRKSFIKGAKWQQEQMYEIMDLYADDVMGGCTLRAKEWFEQFKKK
jgi:hypothetical protein